MAELKHANYLAFACEGCAACRRILRTTRLRGKVRAEGTHRPTCHSGSELQVA